MSRSSKPILVTGAAGFIGAALAEKLLNNGEEVIGIDNINPYYDTNLKKRRLRNIHSLAKGKWYFYEKGIEDQSFLNKIFEKHQPAIVVNLAAQAGVRYSIENPNSYIQSNLVGFNNILESCRKYSVQNLIYASSSSVYGGNQNLPFNENQSVNHPVSLYAATKKANELMAHSYSHLYSIPTTGLRFFTVYGPWGRPDMAPMIFAKSILESKPLSVYNFGNMERDFTFIDDVIEGVFRCCYKPATKNINFDNLNPEPSTSFAPYRIFNIGNRKPIKLLTFIEVLENALGKKAIKDLKEMQPGDVIATAADTNFLRDWVKFESQTSIEQGIETFAIWYKDYFQ